MDVPLIGLTPSKLVDEIFIYATHVDIFRIGHARYKITVCGLNNENIELALWTSRIGCIKTIVGDAENWVSFSIEDEGILKWFKAYKCCFHLEQMDRGHYWIGFSRNNSFVHVRMLTHGYIKVKLVRSNIAIS